jgi:hypothetical protein
MSEYDHPNMTILQGGGIDSRRVLKGRQPEDPKVLASEEYQEAAASLKTVVEMVAFELAIHNKKGTREYELPRENGRALYIGAIATNPHLPHWAEEIHMAQAFVHNVRFEEPRWCKPNGWSFGRYGMKDTVYVDAVGVPKLERHLFGRPLFSRVENHTSAVTQATLEEIELATNAVAAAALYSGSVIPTVPQFETSY